MIYQVQRVKTGLFQGAFIDQDSDHGPDQRSRYGLLLKRGYRVPESLMMRLFRNSLIPACYAICRLQSVIFWFDPDLPADNCITNPDSHQQSFLNEEFYGIVTNGFTRVWSVADANCAA